MTMSVPGGAKARKLTPATTAIRLSRFTKKSALLSAACREWGVATGMLRARIGRAAALVVVILPALLLAASIREYAVAVPHQDQWDIAHFFVEYDRGTLSLGDLFAQVNEYRQFFPNLVFVGVGEVTHWRVEFELALTFLLACLVFTNVWLLARRTLPAPHGLRLAATFLAAVLVFSPVQHENWLLGIQLIYFVPIACVTTAILVAHSRLGSIWKFVLSAGLCAVSTFSSANGILSWFVLLPVLLVLLQAATPTRRRFAAAWTSLLVASATLYFYGYETPHDHPSLTEALTHPLHAAVYVVGFLGSAFAVRAGPDVVAGATAGIAGILVPAAFLAGCAYVWRFRADRSLVERTIGWIALGTYSLATGIAVTVGRVGFGVGQSLASRYTTFSLYLSVALIFLAAIVLGHLRGRQPVVLRQTQAGRAALGAATALVALQVPVFALGFRAMEEKSRELLRGKACLIFINVVPEEACLDNLHPDLRLLRRRANELDGRDFLRPRLLRRPTLGELVESKALGEGTFERLVPNASGYAGSGWAELDGQPAHAVLLTHRRGRGPHILFALAEVGELAEGSSSSTETRWRALFSADRLPRRLVRVSAWSFDAREGRAFQLRGDFAVAPSGSVSSR
jgi:hypothetical protein